MEWLLVPALAVILDITIGDPPNAIHPVAWMGKVISLLEKPGLKLDSAGQFIYGIFMTLFTAALFAIPAYYLLAYLHSLNQVVFIIAAAIILKLMFSIRGLAKEGYKIHRLLTEENTAATRFELRGLVSRDTKELQTPLLASAAVESVAEGTGDSLVAPMFFYLIFGVPGAVAYRAVNTLDSMIGYHGKYEYLGKFAARLDDVLNYIPARLAAIVLLTASACKKRGKQAWRTGWKDHKATESPNAGWPMAVMSGVLGLRLEKPGHYILGKDYPETTIASIKQAINLFTLAAFCWVIVCLAIGGVRFAINA